MFDIFKELNPSFTSSDSLLDFGGNQGNLLHFSKEYINENNYTCLDCSKDSILAGQEEFSKGRFIYWNRYNEMYNHGGNKNEPLPMIGQHDYVWAYSVFSHMVYHDILYVLKWMNILNTKRIVTSYLCNDGDDNSKRVLQYFYNKRISSYESTVDFRDNKSDHFYLLENKYGCGDGQFFIAVYNTEWLIESLKQHGVVAKKITSTKTPIPFLEISYEN